MDPRLKEHLAELSGAINDALADSVQIADVVARIRAIGYDIKLVLEATTTVSKLDAAALTTSS